MLSEQEDASMQRVKLPIGSLEGLRNDTHQAYLGVPFAKPPTGVGRFCATQPVEPWEGTRNAMDYGKSCPQGHHPIPGMAASGPRDEDCLYLNIFTPGADDKARPVLFWIHGGGFRLGSGSELLYHGGHLADRGDVVVVAIHYRLASLGYACFGDAGKAWGASANCGQLDQIEALRWVNRYIGAFGGDPGNVTIFGESAGSAAVGTLLAMPDAKGLFHKAIMQSGVGRAASFNTASKFGLELLDALGVEATDHEAIMNLDVDRIVETTNKLSGDMAGTLGPAIDGSTLIEPPMQANAEGYSADIPLLIGTNRDEVKLFNVTPDRNVPDDGELLKLACQSISNNNEDTARTLIATIAASRKAHALPCDNNDLLDTIQTVARFRNPAAQFAADHVKHQPNTFHYLFTHASPARHGALGACHALEMPFVFGTLDAPTQDRFAGTGEHVERLSVNMMDAWIAFARSANPSHPGIGEWPAYNETERPTMILDKDCRVEQDPFRKERLAVASAMAG
jgi:para-nitrobenzyl esterase